MLKLIEEMLYQAHFYPGCPEYIPGLWIVILTLSFVIVFITKTIIDKLWI